MENSAKSFKEQRIRKITHLYYSRPDVQEAMFKFSQNREISPRYYDGFGKRPDSFQYKGDIFELVKRGATSFHCSEELWQDPLSIVTGMNDIQLNELRIGWDLLIDIDCPWIDYSKLAAKAIIKALEQNGVKNLGLKFSGSKGFHIIIPWKAFPKEINDIKTSDMFPDFPRKIMAYIRHESEKYMQKILPKDFYKQFKNAKVKRGIKCMSCNELATSHTQLELYCPVCRMGETRKLTEEKEFYKCPNCPRNYVVKNKQEIHECKRCGINSITNPEMFSPTEEIDIYELMGLDIVLVSPRHLFRMPYSLHEKTALASVVIDPKKVEEFDLKHADPMQAKVQDFNPDVEENEAKELTIRALDWCKENEISQGDSEEKITGKYADYKPLKLQNISEDNFPPCVKRIFKGVEDGRKRALFVLINLFRSIGMEKEDMEKRIYEWNQTNPIPLKEGYIKSQLTWTYRRKPIMPQNCKEFYQGIGVCVPDQTCNSIKNPVNYVVKKNFIANKKNKKSQ